MTEGHGAQRRWKVEEVAVGLLDFWDETKASRQIANGSPAAGEAKAHTVEI